jgi:hypothetical protein
MRHVRLDEHKLTSLADQRPRRGWSKPRIVENSDTFYFILYAIKMHMESENDKYLFTCTFWKVSLLPMERSRLVVHGLAPAK